MIPIMWPIRKGFSQDGAWKIGYISYGFYRYGWKQWLRIGTQILVFLHERSALSVPNSNMWFALKPHFIWIQKNPKPKIQRNFIGFRIRSQNLGRTSCVPWMEQNCAHGQEEFDSSSRPCKWLHGIKGHIPLALCCWCCGQTWGWFVLFFLSLFCWELPLSIVSSVNSFFELMVTLYEVKIDVFVKHYCGLLSMFDFHERWLFDFPKI